MKKIVSVLVILIFVISGTALAKGGHGNNSQGSNSSGPEGGDSAPNGDCQGQGQNGSSSNDDGPNSGHDTSGEGAPSSGDGVSEGSGW